nr:reverse transcriptase domain-containing protein [Tanacetum cinerariifolium]
MKDPVPSDDRVNTELLNLLNHHRTIIRRYPEVFLCLIRLSRSFDDPHVYPILLKDDGSNMGLLDFVKSANPFKVKTRERTLAEGEVSPNDETVNMNVAPPAEIIRFVEHIIGDELGGQDVKKNKRKVAFGTLPTKKLRTDEDMISEPVPTTTACKILAALKRLDLQSAWDRFKDLLRTCPHHGFLELHQLDTFYNALNSKDQDSLNSAAGVKEICVTCGGAHSYRNCPTTDGNVYRDNIQEFVSQASTVYYNQGNTSYRPPMMSNQIRPPGFPPVSTSSLGTLPSNTITNPKSDLYAITTQSGMSYDGPQIPPLPYFLPMVMENEPEATKDTVTLPNNRSTEGVQPQVVPTESPTLDSEPVNSLNSTERTLLDGSPKEVAQKLGDLDFDVDPRVPLILGRSFLKTERALIDVFEGELTLRVGKEAITFNLDQTSRYSANYNDNLINRIDVIEMACEEYSQEVLSYSDVIASGNPTPYYDPIVFSTSLTLTPFENSEFLLEEVDAFLALEDDHTSPKVDQSYLECEEDILFLEAFLNDDPLLPPLNQGNYIPEVRKELKIYEAKSDKSSIDEPSEVELKDLPPHLEYLFLEGDDKLPVIIGKDLSMEEKTALITVMKSHKRAISWKLFDIKGIDPEFYTHKILMEVDFELAVQHQRRVNPKIHDVIQQEFLKLLDARLIYLISDSPWVSPIHCVPKRVVLQL